MIDFITLKKKHLPMLLEWRTRPEITRFLNTDVKNDMENQLKWFDKIKKDKKSLYWLISYKDELVGLNSLNDIDWRNKFCYGGFYIVKPSFRAILGYYVPHLTLNYIFTNTDLNKSIANILTDNERVVSLYKEIGYREVGVLKNHIKKNGKYHNMILLEYLKRLD